MPFQEKSAWVMSAALLIGGALYFGVVGAMSAAAGVLVRPLLPMIAVYTVLLVVLAIVGHIAIAVLSPKEANAPLDERETSRASYSASAPSSRSDCTCCPTAATRCFTSYSQA